MATLTPAPEASMLRLSRYHCFLGELLESADTKRVTSATIAEELGVSEESVRRDLSFVDAEGRPGAGYDPVGLHETLGEFLGVSAHHPFVAVGNRDMLASLAVVFPAEQFGLRPVAYYSTRREDTGCDVAGIVIRHLSDLLSSDVELGASIALVACEPAAVPDALSALDSAGVHGVLMLTPVLRPKHPEGMRVTYFRIPCALKSLEGAIRQPAPPCGKPCCAATGD